MTRLAYRYYIFDFYDTFAYVYGLLNSREYQEKYANDLKKDLARIPIVKHKEKYVEVGKALMDLHLNYEEVPVYDDVEIQFSAQPSYKVTKMKFIKKVTALRLYLITKSPLKISLRKLMNIWSMDAQQSNGLWTSIRLKPIRNQASQMIRMTMPLWKDSTIRSNTNSIISTSLIQMTFLTKSFMNSFMGNIIT